MTAQTKTPRLSKLIFNGWSLLPLLILPVVLQILSPSPIWMTLIVGLGASLAVSWFWAKQMQRHVRLVREKRYNWTRVGDRLEERFTIINDSFLPVVWVEVRDESTLPGYRPDRATGVGSQSYTYWTVSGVCRHRGVFTLGPSILRTGDPFGLFTVIIPHAATIPLLVLPPILSLPGIEVAPGGQISEGKPRPYAPQPTLLATSVRQYQPGDSLHMIHWPTSARRDSLFVRTFDGAPSGNWWIILDLAASVHSGEDETSTLEQSITLAASLLETGLQQGHAVGFIAHSAAPVWLPPARSETQRWTVLRALATIEAGAYPLASLLRHSGETLGRSASVIVITPSTDPVWLAPLLALRQRDLVPTVMLVPGDPKHPQAAGLHLLLRQQGIAAYILTPEALKPTFDPAKMQGRWEWHTTALGRAVAVQRPQGEWEVVQ